MSSIRANASGSGEKLLHNDFDSSMSVSSADSETPTGSTAGASGIRERKSPRDRSFLDCFNKCAKKQAFYRVTDDSGEPGIIVTPVKSDISEVVILQSTGNINDYVTIFFNKLSFYNENLFKVCENICDNEEVEVRRHLLFSTGKQLGVLGRAARWYVDGTFKCMRAPFIMFLTIHAFVKRADCSKQVQLIFALMSGRKMSDYVAVLESVRQMLCSHQVEGMVIDYEKALWKSVRRVFPGISLSGCAFHWGQAVWSHVQSLGLATAYSRNKATHSYIRKLLSLPFLSHEHIRPKFQQMREFNTSDAIRPLLPLLRYLEHHWFGSSVWSVEWCVFGQAVRTNNDVEG